MGPSRRKEVAHLVGAGETRLIEEVEMLLCRVGGVGIAGEKPLQGSGFDAGFIELAGGAGGGRKALDFVALGLHGAA